MESHQGKKLLLRVGHTAINKEPAQNELSGILGGFLPHNILSWFFFTLFFFQFYVIFILPIFFSLPYRIFCMYFGFQFSAIIPDCMNILVSFSWASSWALFLQLFVLCYCDVLAFILYFILLLSLRSSFVF